MTGDSMKRVLHTVAVEYARYLVAEEAPGEELSPLDEYHVSIGAEAAVEAAFHHYAAREADLRAKIELLEAKINVLEAELAGTAAFHVRQDAGRAPAGPHPGPFDPN